MIRFSVSKKRLTSLRPKIAAGALAVFLWLYVALNETITYDIQCKVVPINIPTGKTIVSPLPDYIIANITGKGTDILWLYFFWKSNVLFNLNMQSFTKYDELQLKNYVSWVKMPKDLGANITVNGIVSPDVLKITIDAYDSVKVLVSEKDITVIPREGFTKVGRVTFIPDSIIVFGPKRIINQLIEITTKSKIYKNKSRSFTDECSLVLPQNTAMKYSVSKVILTVDVQKIGEVSIPNIPVVVQNLPRGITLDVIPPRCTVTVFGGVGYIKNLSTETFKLTINFDKQWSKGKEYTIPLKLEYPEYILNYELSSQTCTILVR